jgi:predicted nucleic acid-binding protein
MPIGRFRYYWDSCVFISVLTGAGRSQEDLEILRKLEGLVDFEAITIFTASITLVEVLASKLTDEQEIAFKGLLGRSNVLPVSVTARIAERAREIRDHYRRNGMEIAVPDSIHLATAIHFGATALHTYDGCGQRPRRTDLLRLETPIIGKYALNICKPQVPQELVPEAPIRPDAETGALFEQLQLIPGAGDDEKEGEEDAAGEVAQTE